VGLRALTFVSDQLKTGFLHTHTQTNTPKPNFIRVQKKACTAGQKETSVFPPIASRSEATPETKLQKKILCGLNTIADAT
jgi:hypothetical protein